MKDASGGQETPSSYNNEVDNIIEPDIDRGGVQNLSQQQKTAIKVVVK